MFLGTPYVDIKADFNSFLSDKLDYKIQTKIMNYYISEFSKKPNFYFDKVESNLIFNCIDFDSRSKLLKLKIKANLSNKEINKIRKSYLDITNNFKNQINLDLKKVKNLDIEINKIIKDKKNHPINKIYNLGSGKKTSINNLAKIFNGKKKFIPNRPGEVKNSLADISKFKKDVNQALRRKTPLVLET